MHRFKAQYIQNSSIVSTHSTLLQRKCACGQHTVAGGECAECRKKRLQRKAVEHTGSETVPSIVQEVLRSPGQPLDAETRAFMEPRFGHDFSQVRVHTDAKAAESARVVNAIAYTVGRDVVFGARQYVPGTSEGQRLLAHELTHVAQQRGASLGAQTSPLIDGPRSLAEREADQMSDWSIQGRLGVVANQAKPGTLQRQSTDDDERRLRLQMPESGQSLGLGQQPRVGIDLPQLQLDPEIERQIRAIQFAQRLLSVENIMSAASQLSSAGFTPASSTTPGTSPSLAPSLGSLPPGRPAPAGGLGTPLSPPARPLVPPGRGPETPRAASVGDLIRAVLRVPAVRTGVERLRTQAESELRHNWRSLSSEERVLVISHSVVISAGIIAGVASSPEARQFVLDQVQGRTIPIPGLPMTFQFNLTGRDQRLVIGLDVGALLPSELGFRRRR